MAESEEVGHFMTARNHGCKWLVTPDGIKINVNGTEIECSTSY